jgi:hypothetical protein
MKKNLILIALILILQSCATVNISSNKDISYTRKPKKIYIEVKCKKDMKEFCTDLTNGLRMDLKTKAIATESHVYDELALESEESRNQEIKNSNPEAILLIQQTVTGIDNTFELTLIDPAAKRPVWKSEISTSTGTYGDTYQLVNKSRKAIISRLTADRLL